MAFNPDDFKHDPGDEGGKGKKMVVPIIKLNLGKFVATKFPKSKLGKWAQRKGWGK